MKTSVQINRGIESLFGTRDENIRVLESGLNVSTHLIDNSLEIEGDPEAVARAEQILEDYAGLVREGIVFNNGDLQGFFRVVTSAISARKPWLRKLSTSDAIWKPSNATTWFSESDRQGPARLTSQLPWRCRHWSARRSAASS